MILGYYLRVEVGELRFFYGRNGKPRLADTFRSGTIPFSMSSSEGLALYGFTRNREIGIDVESIRDIPEMFQIVNLILSARETQVYRALSEHLKREALFACWTRKEAFVKATGDGLSRPLNRFEVRVDPGEPAGPLGIDEDRKSVCQWSIHDLKPASGFAAAIAAEGRNWRLRYWQWTGRNQPQLST
jgi:4'-phosphopantetheinyl transferase